MSRNYNFNLVIFNKYFWLMNVSVWMGMLTLVSFAQWQSASAALLDYKWIDYVVAFLPWFINYIWVTPLVFLIVHKVLKSLSIQAKHRVVFEALMYSFLVLVAYWLSAFSMQTIIRGESFVGFFSELKRVVFSTGLVDIAMYVGVYSAAIGAHFYHVFMNEKMALFDVKSQLVGEQLKTLRAQLSPHFLFNTLNTVTSLIRLQRNEQAIEALSELSSMLRVTLEKKPSDRVPLKEELNFIHSYLSIQKMRFSDKLNIHVDVDKDCLDTMVPNMLLHPIIENAIEHGAQTSGNHNVVELRIYKQEDNLVIDVRNNIARKDDHEGFGIGLNNTKKRLEKLYREFELRLTPLHDDVYQTHLSLPNA